MQRPSSPWREEWRGSATTAHAHTRTRSPECVSVASVLGHTLRRRVHVEPRKVHVRDVKSYCRGEAMRGERLDVQTAPRGAGLLHTHRRPRGSRPGQQLLVLHFVNKGEKRAHSYKSGDTPVTSSSLKWYVHKSSKGKSQVHWLPV